MLHQQILGKKGIIKTKGLQISQFIRESPLVSGAVIGGTVLGGGLLVTQKIRRAKKTKRTRKRGIRKARPRARARKRTFRPRKHRVRATHKHRRKGLDIVHRGKKRGISLKAIRASIASPRTPAQLKRGLRKLLKKRGR